MSTTTSSWRGWLRRFRGPWEVVAEADDEETCRRLLRLHVDQHGYKHCDVYVGVGSQTPHGPKERRSRWR